MKKNPKRNENTSTLCECKGSNLTVEVDITNTHTHTDPHTHTYTQTHPHARGHTQTQGHTHSMTQKRRDHYDVRNGPRVNWNRLLCTQFLQWTQKPIRKCALPHCCNFFHDKRNQQSRQFPSVGGNAEVWLVHMWPLILKSTTCVRQGYTLFSYKY